MDHFVISDNGSGRVKTICSRPEVAYDVISGHDEGRRWVANFSSFRENRNLPFMYCVDDGRPT